MAKEQVKYSSRFTIRRGLQEDLISINETPLEGELIIETDTLKMKLGNGIDKYNALSYIGESELNDFQVQLNAFFENAEIGEAAIDTLVEIQKILNDSSIDLERLTATLVEFDSLHGSIMEEISNLSKRHDEEFAAARVEATTALEKEIARAITAEEEITDRVASLEDTKDDYIAADVSAIKESKAYADSLNVNMDARVKVLEAIDHEAINQELIDLAADYIAADTEITNAFTAEDNAIKANVQKLFDDLALLNEDVNENISDLLNTIVKTREDFESADQVLTTEITAAYETYANAKAEEILDVINNLPSVDLGTVESDLADHKATAEAAFAEIRSAFAEADGVIRTEYQNADNIISATCVAENAAIRGEIAAGDLQIATSLDEEIARATAAELKTLADAKAYADDIKANLLGEGTLNETYDTLKEISDWIATSGVDATELASAIAAEAAARATEDENTRNTLATTANEINLRIDTINATHISDLSLTNSNVATLGEELRTEDNAIKESINSLRTELKNYFDTQLGVIENGSY